MNFYHISHFIQVWILPPGFNLFFILIGIVFFKRSKLAIASLIFGTISLWMLSTPIIAQWMINRLQYQYPVLHLDSSTPTKNAAIIVLGGGHSIYPESKSGFILSDESEFRLRYAAHLYRQTHIAIITSGGKLNNHSPSEAKLMTIELQKYFHTPVMFEETTSINTRDEGNNMVSILQKNHITTAYLVTNAWHMPRAMYTFNTSLKNTGIKIIAAPMGFNHLQPQGILNYLPSESALSISTIAMHEFFGLIAYQLYNITKK